MLSCRRYAAELATKVALELAARLLTDLLFRLASQQVLPPALF
jgi:hypothetical protein